MTKIYSSASWAVPGLIGWTQSQSNSPCMKQDPFARPQRPFFNVSVSDDLCCTSPPPQVWGSTKGKTVIKWDCSVMPVMSQNCHNWETESPRKSRNYEPHIPLPTLHRNFCLYWKCEWAQQSLFCLSQNVPIYTSTLTFVKQDKYFWSLLESLWFPRILLFMDQEPGGGAKE